MNEECGLVEYGMSELSKLDKKTTISTQFFDYLIRLLLRLINFIYIFKTKLNLSYGSRTVEIS